MRFKIEQPLLLDLCNKIISIIPNRPDMISYSLIKITVFGGNLFVETINKETSARGYISAEVLEEGQIALSGKVFTEVIGQLGKGMIDATLVEERLRIKLGRRTLHLATVDPDCMIPTPDYSNAPYVTINNLIAAFLKINHCIAADSYNPNFVSALIRGETLITTDGKRLGVAVLEGKHSRDVLIPASLLQRMKKIFDSNAPLALGIPDQDAEKIRSVYLQQGNINCSIRVMDEQKFPSARNIETLFPKKSHGIVVKREDFLKSLKLASAISGEDNTAYITIHFDSEVTTFILDAKHGSVKDTIPCKNDITFTDTYNLKYLLESVEKTDEADLNFRVTVPRAPLIIEEKRCLQLLMPVKKN